MKQGSNHDSEPVIGGNVFISDRIGEPIYVGDIPPRMIGAATDPDGAYTIKDAPTGSQFVTLRYQYKQYTQPIVNKQAHFDIAIADTEIEPVTITAPRPDPAPLAAAVKPAWKKYALFGGIGAAVVLFIAYLLGRRGSGTTPGPRRHV